MQLRYPANNTTMYKLVAKVLMRRMQGYMGLVVSLAQAGFIPDRKLIENVLLATELVKGYGRGI